MTYKSITIYEPQRGKELLTSTNQAFVWNELAVKMAPVLTDGLVVVYPVLLVVRYLMGTMSGKGELKYGALYVFSATMVAIIVNLVIQFFVDKQRPEWYINNEELLIMDHLPSSPFPSDHAAVWAAVAMATILRAVKAGHNQLAVIWVVLFVWWIIMSLARVGVGIHRPTDILVWFAIGIIVAFMLHGYIYEDTIVRKFFDYLIWIQEWVFGLAGLSK